MLVKTIMLPKDSLTTVTSKTTIGKALNIMDKHKFLSIPVVDGNEFRGSISKNIIYQFYFEKCNDKKSLLEDYNVEHLLRKDMPVINLYEEIEKAVAFLEEMNISFVAVIDDYNHFQGILTHNAVFHQFNTIFGLNKGERLVVTAFDVQGQISKLAKILTENQSDVISFVVVDPQSFTDIKEIVVRMKTDRLDLIKEKIKEAGFKIV